MDCWRRFRRTIIYIILRATGYDRAVALESVNYISSSGSDSSLDSPIKS
tara:strand:+ start:57 stop:203 length:147 start_codon:yes stop_codon:yes gene_type:complete